ncbi:Formate--tetrahydrofolate ligase [Gossypium arboreum]|uniref:Formate--tetrahydrofolate ligase n=1 Tax=Gossypium arboreum TaxID=29729 RepID=A0A0B0P7Y4_GOSAR|nr:Formate--tetrahydrofolate ligase [Gossypium arboreum]
MKLDNEQVICHSTIGYKNDSKPYSFLVDTKPFENKEKSSDATELSTDDTVKENQNGVMHDIKSDELDSDFSIYSENTRDEWTASELDCSNSVHDFSNGNEKEVRDIVTFNSHSSKNMDSFQDSVFYLDKSVMDCELPELVVCYKESTYHVVKDICIDEGVPTQDMFLFESSVDEKSECNFSYPKKDQDNELMKEMSETDIPMQNISFSPEENQSGKDIDNDCGSNKKLNADTYMQDIALSLEENKSNKGIPNEWDPRDLLVTRDMKDDATEMMSNEGSKELFILGDILSFPELTTLKSEAMSPDFKSDRNEQQSFENSSKKEVIVASEVEDSNNLILSAPALASTAEGSDSGKGEATPISPAPASASLEATSSGLVNETGSITFDSRSSAPTSGKGSSEPLETGRTSKLEETADQPFSSNLQSGNGESSFSAAGPLTGLISYSGPITYSGNLSLRSDSSTTSTRSFAFPILQSEWNSSPVRMAKADQRQYRRHRGWRQGFLCCRF